MNTEQLRYFISVANHCNFTEAAREHYVTQPAITHQISALERELGVQLFMRTTRRVKLTHAGSVFLEDAKGILEQQERAVYRLRRLETMEDVTLTIGYLSSATRHFLPQLIRAFRQQYPRVQLNMKCNVASGLLTGVGRSDYDILFTVLSDMDGWEGYLHQKLLTDCYCVVCHREHPCLEHSGLDVGAMEKETFVCMSKSTAGYMYKQFQQICRTLNISPSAVVECPSMEEVLFSVETGQGIAILPYHIHSYISSDLAYVPLNGAVPSIDLGVAWKHPSDNPAVEWFMDMVKRKLVQDPGFF